MNKFELELTGDEMEWLERVLYWGAEVTKFMIGRQFLKGKKDWRGISYELYLKRPKEED